MKVLFMLLICIQAVLADEGCGLVDIQKKMMACEPIFNEIKAYIPSQKTELCESDLIEQAVECVGGIEEECKDDSAYPEFLEAILGAIKNLRSRICPPRDNKVKQSCDIKKLNACFARDSLPIGDLSDRRLEGNFDATDFMKNACRLKDCIPLGRACTAVKTQLMDIMEEELNFVCDGDGKQAIIDLETCINDGQWFEFIDCSTGNPCEDIPAFKERFARCSKTELLNYDSCGVKSVNAVDVIGSKMVELLSDHCSTIFEERKRGLNIQSPIDRIYTLFEESKLRPRYAV